MKENKGITLVALVITIVILIILAVVAINAAFGDSGLIDQAEKAASYQANAEATDSKMLNDATEYLTGLLNNEQTDDPVIPDIDLSNKQIIWFGDDFITGDIDNPDAEPVANSFPSVFSNLEGNELIRISYGKSVISNNINNSMEEVLEVASEYPEFSEVTPDLFIISAGYYDSLYEVTNDTITIKDIGTVSAEGADLSTEPDSIINDFEELIVKINELKPNTKIIYLQPIKLVRDSFEELIYSAYINTYDVSELKEIFGVEYSSKSQYREVIIEKCTNGDVSTQIPDLESHYTTLQQQIQLAANKYDIEYLDLSDDIVPEYIIDGENCHFNETGYQNLTQIIINKVKQLLGE